MVYQIKVEKKINSTRPYDPDRKTGNKIFRNANLKDWEIKYIRSEFYLQKIRLLLLNVAVWHPNSI